MRTAGEKKLLFPVGFRSFFLRARFLRLRTLQKLVNNNDDSSFRNLAYNRPFNFAWISRFNFVYTYTYS